MALDFRHLTGAELDAALDTATWVISLCEGRAARSETAPTAVRIALAADRSGPLLWLDGDENDSTPIL